MEKYPEKKKRNGEIIRRKANETNLACRGSLTNTSYMLTRTSSLMKGWIFPATTPLSFGTFVSLLLPLIELLCARNADCAHS